MTKKQTTREKLIAEAALIYADRICKSRVLDDFNVSVQEMLGVAFFQGARLADENPRPGLVKIEDVGYIYRMWQEEGDFVDFVDYLKNAERRAGYD